MSKPSIVILGAGPAGLGAAYRLAQRGIAQVTLLERTSEVGGNAGSFTLAGLRVDYGSHRLHPSCDPEVLRDIRGLLGADLLDRPRHGRIRLRGRWIHFPLKPLDLALKLPPSFAWGVATDLVRKQFRRRTNAQPDTFASVLEAGLGRTICRDFYFPYAEKIWGVPPAELSATQARRRVSANSLGKMARKVWNAVPGLKGQGSGRFFYPRHGYGQISEAYCRAAVQAGADLELNAQVQAVETCNGAVREVRYEKNGAPYSIPADYVFSTIPITGLARALRPNLPRSVLDASEKIDYRAMILIYLVLEQAQFTPYDAHYFPETDIPISRLSEPKNYSNSSEPQNITVLCAELPCSPNDAVWRQNDAELGNLVCEALEKAGIPVRAPVRQIITQRLRNAYPIYTEGYASYFEQLDQAVSQIHGMVTFGRQGLFAHDNTHHALYMAYAAAACLGDDGRFDESRWGDFRRVFETHVVED